MCSGANGSRAIDERLSLIHPRNLIARSGDLVAKGFARKRTEEWRCGTHRAPWARMGWDRYFEKDLSIF